MQTKSATSFFFAFVLGSILSASLLCLCFSTFAMSWVLHHTVLHTAYAAFLLALSISRRSICCSSSLHRLLGSCLPYLRTVLLIYTSHTLPFVKYVVLYEYTYPYMQLEPRYLLYLK